VYIIIYISLWQIVISEQESY